MLCTSPFGLFCMTVSPLLQNKTGGGGQEEARRQSEKGADIPSVPGEETTTGGRRWRRI